MPVIHNFNLSLPGAAAIASYLTAAVALFIAIFGEWLRSLIWHPRLQIRAECTPPDCERTTLREKLRAGHRICVLTSIVASVSVLAALTCSGETRQERRQRISKVSRSRVLYSDSVLAPVSPVQAIQITVNSSAAYDPTNRHWTYSYAITNENTRSVCG